MSLFKRLTQLLFGTGGSASSGSDIGLYYYIKSKKTGEIIRLRVNPNNDLSASDDEGSYFVRKVVSGTRGYDPIEVELTYNKNRKLQDSRVIGGDMVDKAEWDAQQAKLNP
jgi:hypothetical protein